MASTITIAGRKIGPGQPVYIVAEMSANHCGDFMQADRIVRAAAAAGADAIKLQTFAPDTITMNSRQNGFMLGAGSPWAGRSLYDLYKEAAMPWGWQPKLQKIADEEGITLFSTPFDTTAVDFLEEMNVPCYKVSSFEIVDIPLLQKIGATGKPVILSTGMASFAEISEAVDALTDYGTEEIALLKCVSAYPAEPSDMNLRTLPHMTAAFNVPVGLSDHTLDSATSVVAVSLGACIIEKHIKLSAAEEGPDAAFSLDPEDFQKMVAMIRKVGTLLGSVLYGPTQTEKKNLAFRRSLYVVRDIKAGETFIPENVRSIRPGYGLHTRHYSRVLGKVAEVSVSAGTPLEWRMVG